MYERLVERIVCMFIPFYSELKMVFVIFLTLTKARSAEPIYLHILRPLIKPYVPILDVVLDVGCGLGDFVLSLVLFPIHYVLSYFRGSQSEGFVSDEDDVATSRDSAVTAVDEFHQSHKDIDAPRHPSEASDSDRGHVVEECRKYPAFPSAYPHTPLPPQNPLTSPQPTESISLAPIGQSRSIWLPPRTPLNPGSISSSSDDDSIEKADPLLSGGPVDDEVRDEAIEIESDDTEGQQDVHEDEDDDDSFNVTLQTPMAPYGSLKTRLAARSVREPIEISESNSASPASSTILNGLERSQSVRTVGSTDSSSSLSISEPQRIVAQRGGRKKPQSKVAERDFLRPKAGVGDESSASNGKRRPVAKPSVTSSLPQLPSKTSLDEDEDDEQPESESDAAADPDFKLRRRRIGPQTVNGRPTTRATTTKGLKTAVSVSQLRPPSSRRAESAPTTKSTRGRGAKSVPMSRPSSETR